MTGGETVERLTSQQIIDIASKYFDQYDFVGVRTQEEPFELGKIDHLSSVWDDGDVTEDYLNGISVTDVNSNEIKAHSSDKHYSSYYGDYQAIICGNFAEGGNDIGELIIIDPVVVEIIK